MNKVKVEITKEFFKLPIASITIDGADLNMIIVKETVTMLFTQIKKALDFPCIEKDKLFVFDPLGEMMVKVKAHGVTLNIPGINTDVYLDRDEFFTVYDKLNALLPEITGCKEFCEAENIDYDKILTE